VEPSVGVKETRCSTVKSRHWRFSTTLEDSSVPTVPEHQLRLTLQLPDSLARHLLLAAGFGKRHRFLMVEAVAAHQDVPVAREKPSYALQNPGASSFRMTTWEYWWPARPRSSTALLAKGRVGKDHAEALSWV
jgi:hypothetical protein